MVNYQSRKTIRDTVFTTFQKALLNGDKTYLVELQQQYAADIVITSNKPKTIEELEKAALQSKHPDSRSPNQILKDCKAEHQRQSEAYYHPRREGYVADLKTAHKAIDDLSIGYRAYTPWENCKNISKFAFWHSVTACAIPLIANISLDSYIPFALAGALIGACRGAIDNNCYFDKQRLETSKFLRNAFKPKSQFVLGLISR